MYEKSLILIGRSFIATFLVVNFFNIIPLNVLSNAWIAQVSMLLVDTASLLLIGIVSLKIYSLMDLKCQKNNSINMNKQRYEFLLEKKEKNIVLINSISKSFMMVFILLGIIQFYSFFNGMNSISSRYLFKFQEIDNLYSTTKDKLELETLSNSLETKEKLDSDSMNNSVNSEEKLILLKKSNSLDIEEKLKNIKMKRDIYRKDLTKSISKAKFLLIRGNLKVLIMSLIWAFALLKVSNLNYK